jgi:hypothetical protein
MMKKTKENSKQEWALIPLEEKVSMITALATKSSKNGEMALMEIAEQGSDLAAKEVVAAMPPLTINQIVQDFDYSDPSIVAGLLGAQQVVAVLNSNPLLWQTLLNDDDPGVVSELMNNMENILTQILLTKKDDSWFAEVIDFISTDENCLIYLALPYVRKKILKINKLDLVEIATGTTTSDLQLDSVNEKESFKLQVNCVDALDTNDANDYDVIDLDDTHFNNDEGGAQEFYYNCSKLFNQFETEEGKIGFLYHEINRLVPDVAQKIFMLGEDAYVHKDTIQSFLSDLLSCAKSEDLKKVVDVDDMFTPLM